MESTTKSQNAVAPSRTGVAPSGVENVSSEAGCLVIVDFRTLERQCLAETLAEHEIGMAVAAVGSMQEWRGKNGTNPPPGAILYNLGGRTVSSPGIADELRKISSEFKKTPVIVIADTDDLPQILATLECGARGYIPSSVGIDVCVEAISLAVSGGIFVPASSVLSMRHLIDAGASEAKSLRGVFTQRQSDVAQALSHGKANKIIAYELNLQESTVKVHIRNIMKKLKATNRTEVAIKIKDMFAESALPE